MKKMKKIIASTMFAFTIMQTSTSSLIAQQDSVKTVYDTVKVIQTEKVIHDTVRVPVQTPPKEEAKKERPPLRRGEFGLRFMPTFTSLALKTNNGQVVEGQATLSYGYGIMLGVNLSKNVGLQAEVNYNSISQKYKDQNLDREIRINYINIPVLLSINTDKTRCVNFNVVAGPQFGLNVGSSMTTNGNNNTDTLQAVLAVKQGDVGLAYGAGFEFALNRLHTIRFDLGFRGVYGLVNIDDNTNSNNTYNVLVRASRKSYAGYAGFTFLF